MTEHSTSLPRQLHRFLDQLRIRSQEFDLHPVHTNRCTRVKSKSHFLPTGPALADALPISARAIAPAPHHTGFSTKEAFGPLASASNTPASARARPIPASAMYPALGILCPGLFLRPDAYDPCLA